uniref:Lysosomal alpha-glucosidase n=1 Tax=Cacopsylla melanoneura TaxID=428564 RepID=A0A8D9EPS6_9HEMI
MYVQMNLSLCLLYLLTIGVQTFGTCCIKRFIFRSKSNRPIKLLPYPSPSILPYNVDPELNEHLHNDARNWPQLGDRIDCYHEDVKDKQSCLNTGCCWDPVPLPRKGPSCFYPILFVKMDCFPSGEMTKEKCLAKGCHWNMFMGFQYCFYPPNYKTHRTDLPQCVSDTFTTADRKACVDQQKETTTELGCIQAGCCWSPLKLNSKEPWCFLPWNVIKENSIRQLRQPEQNQCPANPSDRFNCFPRGFENQRGCNARGCCWTPTDIKGQHPACYYPSNYKSYALSRTYRTSNGPDLIYIKQIDSPYLDDIEMVRMEIVYETNTRVRVKISDLSKIRYESIYPEIRDRTTYDTSDSTRKYTVSFSETKGSSFGFAIERKDSNKTIFDTRNVGGFTMSDQFLQISAQLGSHFVYGLGDVSKSFLTDFNWRTFNLFAKRPNPSQKDNFDGNYGSHPFYLAMEPDGNSSTGRAHGVLLLNSNSLEVELQPKASITYRAIGGILDFYFFLGETPSEVIQQYLELIGKPNLPPYWSLGFQLSKSGWRDLDDMKAVVSRTLNNSIPLDVVYGGIDYGHKSRRVTGQNSNWTIQLLPDYVASLHAQGIKFVSLFHPTIEYVSPLHAQGIKIVSLYDPTIETNDNYSTINGRELDVFVKQYQTSKLYSEKLLDSSAAYIDFTHPKVYPFWRTVLSEFRSKLQFDGVVLDYNEPSTIKSDDVVPCPLTKWDDPPFVSKFNDLKQNTLCMSASLYYGLHYNLHNLYGIAQSAVTYSNLKNILKSRPFIVSRSTFPGSGRYVAHWTGSIYSDWDSLRQSITDMLLMNMFGLPMVGADFCGFNVNATTELCARWSALGAFYPLSRYNNSNDGRDQNPPASSTVLSAARNTLLKRYELIPYLYTLLYKAHRFGHTVVRPMFFEFPRDVFTFSMDKQFLWGSALLFVPVLEEKQLTVEAYLPGTWYSYPMLDKKYQSNPSANGSSFVILNANITEIPILIREGSIIVLQTPGDNLAKSRQNEFKILIVLDDTGRAEGELYWDDGDTLDTDAYNHIKLYTIDSGTIKVYKNKFNYNVSMPIKHITIVGVQNKVHYVTINKETVQHEFKIKDNFNILEIDTKDRGLNFKDNFQLELKEIENSRHALHITNK